jgi:integrase
MIPTYEKLAKGLAIYRQKHAKNFYVRVRVAGKDIRRNLGTPDEEEAKFRAWELRSELENRKKEGLPILTNSRLMLETVLLKVIENLNNKEAQLSVYRDYTTVLNNFIKPFFNGQSIEDFTSKNIKLYFESQKLSVTRKNINKTCFRMIFDYLLEEKLMKKSDLPELPKVKSEMVEVRDAFTNEDLKLILTHLETFHSIKKVNFKTKEYRKILYHYFILLIETGMRTGEKVISLKYNDLIYDKENENYFIKITKGKTKGYSKPRQIALSKKAIRALVEICRIQNPEKNIGEDNFLYVRKNILESSFGKTTEYSDIFGQFMKYMKDNNFIDNHYTLYCCRHYFITKRLSQNVDIYLIAKYVGSSVEMIQKHYDNYMLTEQTHIDSLTNYPEHERKLTKILKSVKYDENDILLYDVPPDPTKEEMESFEKEAECFFDNVID